MISDLKTDIENLAEPLLASEGFELVEIKLSRYKSNFRLQIFVDSDNGVTLDKCVELSKIIGAAVDVEDILDSKYILEVSSPGLDRHLHTQRDFERKIGKNIKVEYTEGGKKKRIRGSLTDVDTTTILINGEDGEFKIALSDIRQGKVVI
ncbi:MAG: ribosome maturation factor RimP [candidate division Zixibacteria bacterium]